MFCSLVLTTGSVEGIVRAYTSAILLSLCCWALCELCVDALGTSSKPHQRTTNASIRIGCSSSSSMKALNWKMIIQCEKMTLIWTDCGFPCIAVCYCFQRLLQITSSYKLACKAYWLLGIVTYWNELHGLFIHSYSYAHIFVCFA